ncbi:MAG: SRPBCC family protein [Bacteroidota bacterium]
MKTLNVSQFTTAPQQVEKSYLVHAPIEEVWKVVADHQGMTQWMPMIKHVELVQANEAGEWGEGCERHCQFGPDLLEEKIVHWDPPYGYAYRIGDMHLVKDHLGHIKLESTPEGTKVTWTQFFHPNGNFVKRFMARNVMIPTVMTKALKNLERQVA